LAEEISEAEAKLGDVLRAAEERVRRIQDESASRILDVLKDATASMTALSVRLVHLRAARSDDDGRAPPPSPKRASEPVPSSPMPKLRSAQLILEALAAGGSLHATNLDAIVIAGGWSKGAAEKARQLLKKRGDIAVESRNCALTDAGRTRLRERPGVPTQPASPSRRPRRKPQTAPVGETPD